MLEKSLDKAGHRIDFGLSTPLSAQHYMECITPNSASTQCAQLIDSH